MEKTGKSGPLMETDLEFLGYHDVKRVEAEESRFRQQACRIFEAKIRAGIAEHDHCFVYLWTGCRNEDIQKIGKAVLNNEDSLGKKKSYIVIPERMDERMEKHPEKHRALKRLKGERRVYVFEDLIWNKVKQEFSEYMEKNAERIENLQAKHYVTPQLENNGGDTVSPRYIYRMLRDDKRTRESIVVIKAGAGVGKTTLAEKLASLLVKSSTAYRIVPLLLTGQAGWRELSERSHNANNLGDIIISLFEADGADFPLRDIEQFTRIMRLGYFAFIFDGFDELTKPSGAVSLSPRENFDWLANIATGSNARIMLTTRSSFWNREISSQTAEKHTVFSLKPFNSESVYKYFDRYFTDKENYRALTRKAKRFYRELQESQGDDTTEDSFFNLPACAMMIANQVNKKDHSDSNFEMDKDQHPARKLFMQILRRENIRQQTGIEDFNAMHEVFENTAIFASNEFENEFELKYIAYDPKCEIQEKDIGKIEHHAFFKATPSDGGSVKVAFQNDFLFHYLQASCIRRLILEETDQSFGEKYTRDKALRDLIDSEADGSGHLSEQVSHYFDMSDVDKVVGLHKACSSKSFGSLESFLFHIIARTVIFYGKRKSHDRKEIGDNILSRLGDKEARSVSNLHIRGELDEISLSDWTIRDSRFVDFSLGERGSHDGLLFVGCHFSGNLSLPESFGVENFKNCTSKGPAKLVLNEIDSSVEISGEETRKNLESVLKRFWLAHANVKSVSEGHWKTGITVAIEKRYSLLEILKQEEVVEQHKHRALLQIKGSSINDVKEFMENGIVLGRVHAVLKRMNEEINRKK